MRRPSEDGVTGFNWRCCRRCLGIGLMGRTILSGIETSGGCTRDVVMCDPKEKGSDSSLKLVMEAAFLFVFVSILNNVSSN